MYHRIFALAVALVSWSSSAAGAEAFKLVTQEGRYSEYEGSLTLNGRFERRQDAESLEWRGDRVCFFPEAAGVKQLPGKFDTKKPAMFCFTNTRTVIAMLKLPPQPPVGACGVNGTARVRISRYVVESGTGETYDLATLDNVSAFSAPSALSCP